MFIPDKSVDRVGIMRLMAVYSAQIDAARRRKDPLSENLVLVYRAWYVTPAAPGAFDKLAAALRDFIAVVEDGKR